MKKNVKRVLTAIVVILILLTGVIVYYYFPVLSMKPVETGQIYGTNIFGIKNNMGTVFFIKTDNGCIMIDTGSDPQKLATSLKESGMTVNDVKWILLTHSDYDHVAGLSLFPNAEIYLSEDELPLITGKEKRAVFGGNTLPAGVNVEKITLLSDRRELLLNGTKIECIKAPGHTTGSMAYLVDGQYLFTGDAFKVYKGEINVHPYTMNVKLAQKTIEKLKTAINRSSIVLTSHYGLLKKEAGDKN
jgi:glyoxylase-like metal-dependent hydrolase (beta-lactamase superfamily II)